MVNLGKEGEQSALFEFERTEIDSPKTLRTIADLLTPASPDECAEYIKTPLLTLLRDALGEINPASVSDEVVALDEDFEERRTKHSHAILGYLKGLINEWIFGLEGGRAPTLFHPFSLGQKNFTFAPDIDSNDPFPFTYEFLISEGEWNCTFKLRFDQAHRNLDWLFHPVRVLAERQQGTIGEDKILCQFGRARKINFFEITRAIPDSMGYFGMSQTKTLRIKTYDN